MTYVSKQFSSPHFEIQELAEGVFAVLGDREALCHSNAAIVDLGDRSLVLDTLTLPSFENERLAPLVLKMDSFSSWIRRRLLTSTSLGSGTREFAASSWSMPCLVQIEKERRAALLLGHPI